MQNALVWEPRQNRAQRQHRLDGPDSIAQTGASARYRPNQGIASGKIRFRTGSGKGL
ncbi:MAG: hypothetical protein AAGD07_06850 [Planctomycetota bacterium]